MGQNQTFNNTLNIPFLSLKKKKNHIQFIFLYNGSQYTVRQVHRDMDNATAKKKKENPIKYLHSIKLRFQNKLNVVWN